MVEIGDVESHLLVPGDVIIVPARGFIMSCDAVLIAGNAIVDEGMLTGNITLYICKTNANWW